MGEKEKKQKRNTTKLKKKKDGEESIALDDFTIVDQNIEMPNPENDYSIIVDTPDIIDVDGSKNYKRPSLHEQPSLST